jgi:two-component system chemotaxis response regulator CheB
MTFPSLIRTLVVDDSAFVRKIVREMLSHSPAIEVVGVARDGEEALALAETLQPDVITCDLMMPRMDGAEFVRRQMAKRPVPILVLTASPEDAAQVLEALAAGAVDVVRKPTALATDELFSIRTELIDKVKAARGIHAENLALAPAPAQPAAVQHHALKVDIVVLGISTGGPQALRRLLPQIPGDFPVPIAMVLHMPVGYTALYAEKLNELCQLEVKEAAEGDLLRPGLALLAQAGRHLTFRKTAKGSVMAQLPVVPLDKIHRPSVDVLFQSAAEVYHGRVLAVVMTGMGDDGKQGAAWVKAQGGTVLTEAEQSCVIYGMPRSVAEAGLSDAAVLLDDMAQAITQRI